MGQCPRCGSSAQADPEHTGVRWCLTCWHAWALPRAHACPGHLPVWNAALRTLAAYDGLRR